jgi:Glyoxalase-like domain
LHLLELDHVLIAVTDLAAAAREIEARHGLVSIDGGRHPGWGTANRIVPLCETYLELVAVVDEEEAAQTAFGRWVAGARPEPVRPLGWAVRTPDLDRLAERLGLSVSAGSRASPGADLLRWRTAGIEQAAKEPPLPFFIEWGQGTSFPGRAAAGHRPGSPRIARVELSGDPDRLAAWLGGQRLPITVQKGAPAIVSVTLTGPAGEIVLRAGR